MVFRTFKKPPQTPPKEGLAGAQAQKYEMTFLYVIS